MPLDNHRINLLPASIKVARQGRQFVALVFAGCAAFVVLLGFLWFQKGQQVSSANAQTQAQKSRNVQLQGEIAKLDYIETKSKAVGDKEKLVRASWNGEVSWYRLLQDLATTMPSQTWLTAFQADNKGPAGAPAPGAKPAEGTVIQAGQFSVGGIGFDHPDSADWLARISQMKQVANAWLASSTVQGGDDGSQQQATFQSSASLTSSAWSWRAEKAADPTANIFKGTNAE